MKKSEVRAGLLDGVSVLDLTRVLAGPICGRALADLGARVIKVEPPAGDLSRFSVPRHGAVSGYYAQQNSGKENVSIDLDHAEGRSLLFDLAATADVVLENFRPGVCAKWGVAYDDVAEVNPGVVYGSLTGYGQTGPWADRRAYAVVSHASSGMTDRQINHLTRVSGAPVLANDAYSHGDVYTGLAMLSGVLAALFRRERTGHGQHVDVAMLDTMLFVNEHAQASLDGAPDVGDPAALSSQTSPVLRAANGDLVTVAGDPAGHAYEGFRMALGHEDADFTRRLDWDDLRLRAEDIRRDIAEWAATIPTGEDLRALFTEVGVATDLVRTIDEVAASEHAVARGTIVTVDDRVGGSFRIPQTPWRFSDATSGVAGPPSWRGEHNRTVMSELLGLDDTRIDELEAAGVLVSRPPRPVP